MISGRPGGDLIRFHEQIIEWRYVDRISHVGLADIAKLPRSYEASGVHLARCIVVVHQLLRSFRAARPSRAI